MCTQVKFSISTLNRAASFSKEQSHLSISMADTWLRCWMDTRQSARRNFPRTTNFRSRFKAAPKDKQ
jgi:hypothetical protein